MSKHTPGPWTFDEYNHLIDSKSGYPIASVKVPTKSAYPQSIKTKDKERDANARLIAAAPELLSLSERIQNNPSLFEESPEFCLEFDAVIAKAKGENNE